ncbi:hypothetical protein L7F22_020167 [Adiantum nelumboides]|nr:hypothetical protein [Adiantum nelumboides]
MGEPSSSWQNFNFRDDEGSAQGMQALRLLLAKLQEAQANPRLKPSVNNLLMTEDLMLTSTQRLPSSVAPMHLEGGEGVPVMHGPMQANVVPHPLQGPLQTDGAKKKQYHGQERHVGKIREEGDFHDDDDEPPSRSRHKKRTNERRTKRSRRNSSGGSSSSSQSGRSSHGRFPKKELQDCQEAEWQDFKKALKEEYFLEDSQRRYDHLSATEQRSIRSERVKLFEQAADARLQKSLEQLLKDTSRELGLTSDWKPVPDAVNLIVKRQMRVDKIIVGDSSETSDEEVKDKSTTLKYKLKEPVLDDLVKGIQELNLNLKVVKLEGWSNPVDSLSMYAYIAQSEANEAWVEEKRKRDKETPGSSKRATRSNNKKEEVPKPTPEVNIEDAPKDKKQEDDEEAIPKSHFTRTHWARATTETIVKLGDIDEPVLALVDHGSKIYLMSKSIHQNGRWPIDVNHGWRIRVASMLPRDLYNACTTVKVTIGDVCDEHNFFIQEHSSYPIILGQPYIMAVRMETKLLDDGLVYARVRSREGKRAIQFLTVCVNHARNKDSLRDHSLPRIRKEFQEDRFPRDFFGVPL